MTSTICFLSGRTVQGLTLHIINIIPSTLSTQNILDLFSFHLCPLVVPAIEDELVWARPALKTIDAVGMLYGAMRSGDGENIATRWTNCKKISC